MAEYDGHERRDMSTHNVALTALNTIEFHMKECDKRQIQYEKKQDGIIESLEQNRNEISKLTKWAFAAIAVLVVAMRLSELILPLIFHKS